MAKKTTRTFHCDTPSQGYKGSSRLRQYTQSKVADSSHSPEPFLYKCEPCNQVFLFKIPSLLNHFRWEHPHLPLPYCGSCKEVFDTSTDLQKHNETKHAIDSKTPASSEIAQMDASDLNSRRDDDDVLDTNVNGWGSPEDVRYFYAQRDPALVENHPSALLNGDISKPLSTVSELTSNWATAGSSPSKLDTATALARAALRNRFAELGVLKSGETTPLFISNMWGPRKANSSASNLDASGSNSVATESQLPLNSLNVITRPFTCPTCQRDFKLVSGFVLHIENRLCISSMCLEIEDRLNACITQFLNSTLASSGKA